MKKNIVLLIILVALAALAGCGPEEPAELTPVTLMLDWVPNVNHTGIFAAEAQGFFEEEGLDVTIIQPGEVYPEAAVVSGEAEFGISFQEYVALSRADDLPLVSIGAIIQHNTSGFAAPVAVGLETPVDFEGLRYGSFGSPFEAPIIEGLMACTGGDFAAVEFIETGYSDPLALMDQGQIDFAWIFAGVQGVAADVQGIDLDIVMLDDYFDCIPDYYTPVVISSEDTLAEQPEMAAAFMQALTRGYEYAIENPDEGATILLEAAPELDETIVRDGMAWMAARYQADATRWGEQDTVIWDEYITWLVDNAIIETAIDAEACFTNEFLP